MHGLGLYKRNRFYRIPGHFFLKMVKSCSAYACKSKFIKGGPITFHCFPKDENRRKQWETQLRRENFKATNYTSVCSRHFTADCYEIAKLGGTWLKKDAVPTIFDFPPTLIKNTNSRKRPQRSGASDSGNNSEEPLNSEMKFLKDKRRCYYLGDYTEDDMKCPAKATRVLQLAKQEQVKNRKSLIAERRMNFRLKNKVASMRKTLKGIKKSPGMACQVLKSSESVTKKVNNPIETTIKIKKEPIEDCPIPPITNTTISEEFILPNATSWTTPKSAVEPQFILSVASLAVPDEPGTSEGEYPKKEQRIDQSATETPASVPNGTEARLQTLPREEMNDQLEFAVKIKQEPIDYHPKPSTSINITNKELILRSYRNVSTSDSVVEPQCALSVACPREADTTESEQSTKKCKADSTITTLAHTKTPQKDFGTLNPESAKEQHSKDQFSAFGQYVAEELRSLDLISSTVSQKVIRDIILEAKLGNYQSGAESIKSLTMPVGI